MTPEAQSKRGGMHHPVIFQQEAVSKPSGHFFSMEAVKKVFFLLLTHQYYDVLIFIYDVRNVPVHLPSITLVSFLYRSFLLCAQSVYYSLYKETDLCSITF